MVRIVILISFFLFCSLGSFAQLGLDLRLEQNSLSNSLRAAGLYNFYFNNEWPSEEVEAYFGKGDDPFAVQNYQHISFSIFDSIKGNKEWGLEYTNFMEAYSKHSLFNLLYYGNAVQKEASLDDLHIKAYQLLNLSHSKVFSLSEKDQLSLKFKMGLVLNYFSLKNREGSIENRNDGQDIYLAYNYQLLNSFNAVNGLNLGLDLFYSRKTEDWNYSLELRDLGLFLLKDLNGISAQGDTLYQGVDIISYLAGEEEENLFEYLSNGDTINTLQSSSAQVFANVNKKLSGLFIDEIGLLYRSYSLMGNIHSIGFSLKKELKNENYLRAEFAGGSLSPLEIGLMFAKQTGKHKFLIGSKQVFAPILPTFSPGIQFTIQYQIQP